MDCDIIIPVYDQLNYTRSCVESIKKHTDYPHRVIVVDDASSRETAEYLDSLSGKNEIVLLRNQENLGWVKSVNKGIGFSKAKYVCVMNNDILVYPSWLSEMVKIAQKDSQIGLVNPLWELPKNFRGNRSEYFKNVVQRQEGKFIETDWARGYCFLVKRAVLDRIGGLDERFSPGYYDDWDYSLRAINAGFIPVRAQGAFVWHYKNISFGSRFGKDRLNQLLNEKRKIFENRWGGIFKIVLVFGQEEAAEFKTIKSLTMRLLRAQNKLVVATNKKNFDVVHTNCKLLFISGFMLKIKVFFGLFYSLRLRPEKRYALVICSDDVKMFLNKFIFLKNNFRIETIKEALSYNDTKNINFVTRKLKYNNIILGIGPSMFHDPAAALLIDGKIVAAAEEERFIRKKHASNQLCLESIAYCLKQAGIKANDIDKVVFAWDPAAYQGGKFAYFGRKFGKSPDRALKTLLNARRICQDKRDIVKNTCAALGVDFSKAVFIEHHLAHAASAFYFSGFKESAILSIDGSGEFTATWIGKAKDNEITMIKEFAVPESLGLFYSTFTEYLGFESNDGEYKLMGMAPYGDASRLNFDDILAWDQEKKSYYCNEDYIWVKRSQRFNTDKMYSKLMVKRFGLPRKGDGLDDNFVHVAAGTQKKFEDTVLKLVDAYLSEELLRHGNLCFSGGCALNVSLNRRLLTHSLIKNLWVQPASNDSGTSLGAAAYVAAKLGNKIEPLTHVYWGPEFSNKDIEQEIRKSSFIFTLENDICKTAADLLDQGEIVGWFQGRMEWGPRALGNRSILGNPTIRGTADRINAIIKFRENWRPFCPSILKEHAADILQSEHPAPFMTIAFKANPKWKERIPEVIHVDGTCRPQVVEKEVNPKFHKVIENFFRLSGVPVVINTSLNRRGEPMICSPRDAMLMFKESGLEYLAMGDFLVRKKKG